MQHLSGWGQGAGGDAVRSSLLLAMPLSGKLVSIDACMPGNTATILLFSSVESKGAL